MVHCVDTINIDGEKFIDYCSENDFNYSIKIGEKCKVFLVNKKCYIGTLHEIYENLFILQLVNGENVKINYSDIDDIFCEEEIGTIN